MSDLFSLLSQSSSSLGAHRASLATSQHNMANVNTEGYSRQRAQLEAVQPAGYEGGSFIGRGARLWTVTQARDRFLEAQMPRAIGDASWSQSNAEMLMGVSSFDVDAPGGVNDAMSGFYSSLRELQLHPSDPGYRAAAVNSAKSLTASFNRTAAELESARSGIDQGLAARADRVNALAAEVARLNTEVRIQGSTGAPPNDLIDARRRAADELVALTGASVVKSGSGDVNLQLPGGGGTLVVGKDYATMSLIPDASNRGHASVVVNASDGSQRTLDKDRMGGTMGGMLEARDVELKEAEEALDQLAFEFADALNTIHAGGVGQDGSTGNGLFTHGGVVEGAARDLRVDATVEGNPDALALSSTAGGLPGDTGNLEALISSQSADLASGGTAAEQFANATTRFGAGVSSAIRLSEQDATVLGRLEDMRASISGVSLDEEMIEMTKAQKAFEALTKVIATTDEMLDTLMQIKR